MNRKYINEDYSDKSKLSNRLRYLMFGKAKMNSPKDLAKKVFETKLIFSKKSKLSGNEYNLKQEDAIYKDIQEQLESSNNEEYLNNLTGAYIKAYSLIFNCSANYLTGETEIISNDPKMVDTVTYTNLSEESINSIRKITLEDVYWSINNKTENSIILSKILSSSSIHAIVNDLVYFSHEYETNMKLKNSLKVLKSKIDSFDQDDVRKATSYETEYKPTIYKDSNGIEKESFEEIVISDIPSNFAEILETIEELTSKSYDFEKIKDKINYRKFQLHKNYTELIDELFPVEVK